MFPYVLDSLTGKIFLKFHKLDYPSKDVGDIQGILFSANVYIVVKAFDFFDMV